MSEPVIEVVTFCEECNSVHPGHVRKLGYEGKSPVWCQGSGGSRVRYTRQEAIDRIATNSALSGHPPTGVDFEDATDAIDALLGETDV